MIFSYDDYVNNGRWSVNDTNCSDPKQLLESITLKFEDVIKFVRFEYYWQNESSNIKNDTNENQSGDWSKQDTQKFGRCFTLSPSVKQRQNGITVGTVLSASDGLITSPN